MIPRGVRNNNPGNIRYVEGVTSTYLGCVGSDGAFCKFDTPEHGIRALGKLLLSYQQRHGIKTIREAINRWAPPVENDTGAYVSAVAMEVGYGADTPLDFSDAGILRGLAVAIIKHENGQQPYTESQIADGIGMALGVSPAPAPSVEPPPVVVQPERKMPIFLSALLQLIPGLITVFGKDSERAKQNAQTFNVVSDAVVKAVPGATDLPTAISAMVADPAVKAKAEAEIMQAPAILALLEVGGGVIEARKSAADPLQVPFYKNPAFLLTLVMLPMPYYVVIRVLDSASNVSAEVQSGVIMAVISGVLSAITGFWLGTSFGSSRKTEIIANR